MSEEFKIYTKTGDKGQTSLIGGTRVPKCHPRIEAYGTVDELKSYIGLVRDQDISEELKALLIEVQDRLFTIESQLAHDPDTQLSRPLPEIAETDILRLESAIDQMNEELEPLSNFILPGGHPAVSHCHIARCICRRAERITIRLSEIHPVTSLNIKYLNRLSDYLFVLARKVAKDHDAPETLWKPRV
ncbi:MAG: cob(I)yrinic acid a,c-diamide adenosyltransferase [Bacteroidetes bacterium]|nr:MAG: cob(I)yrinic acid a,c-diamide adenosyltransferase [Bacteroidota bacterium]RLD81694.1 MAG: cob(I)yrinic acid a,c-diamide adenosyltransferase [Bacteroidota bacterium]